MIRGARLPTPPRQQRGTRMNQIGEIFAQIRAPLNRRGDGTPIQVGLARLTRQRKMVVASWRVATKPLQI